MLYYFIRSSFIHRKYIAISKTIILHINTLSGKQQQSPKCTE